jgi:hypothetical protein
MAHTPIVLQAPPGLQAGGRVGDFFLKLPPKALLRAFAGLQMASEQPPAARGNDALDVVTQLQQPKAIALQQGQGHLYRHGLHHSTPKAKMPHPGDPLIATLVINPPDCLHRLPFTANFPEDFS